jgi:2-polyprenyl-3-methyl-5-hydroxy-6-metoxy-1,4-benzoquinol methylase
VLFKRCQGCGLWRQDPQPELHDVLARYGDEYLAYETDRHLEYRAISLRSLGEAGLDPASSVGADGRKKSILEIGCATGALLSAFAESGWNATGVETGASMAAYARSTFGLDVRTGTLEHVALPQGSFDTVVATHLIEHLNDPISFLRTARAMMRGDGNLFLITPNVDGLQARIMRSKWRSAIRDHLFLFSKRTLAKALAVAGFTVEYAGTWGGWPASMPPAILKRPLDGAAKRLGWGDVMVVRASLSRRSADQHG